MRFGTISLYLYRPYGSGGKNKIERDERVERKYCELNRCSRYSEKKEGGEEEVGERGRRGKETRREGGKTERCME